MRIPKLNDHPAVVDAKQAAAAARNHRDELRRKAAELADRQSDLEQRSRASTASADQLEVLRELPRQLDEVRADLRIANKRDEEAHLHHEATRNRIRREMRTDRSLEREISQRRSAVVKKARALAEAQQSAVDLLQGMQEAGLAQFDGPFGDAPPAGITLRGFPTAASLQSALLAAIAELENTQRK